MAPFDMQTNVGFIVVSGSVDGREEVSKRRNKDPSTPRFTRSALKAKVHIQKQDMKKLSRRNSTTTAVSLFTEEVDSSSWTDSSVRRCTRHMAKDISLRVCQTKVQLGKNLSHLSQNKQTRRRLFLSYLFPLCRALEGNYKSLRKT
jgi:hypothetical protein